MEIRAYSDFETFARECREAWLKIVAESPSATPFQAWEWLAPWWRHYGHAKQFIGLAARADGAIVGGALFFVPRFTPLRTLRWVGDGGSDYLDLIASPGHEEAVAQAISNYLRARGGWDWADLQQVRPGAVARRLADTFSSAELWHGETCPYLPLAPDWDGFKKTLGKKLRSNIGYYERALAKQFSLEFRLADRETLTGDMTAFYDLHQKRWRGRLMPGAFRGSRPRSFHLAAASGLLEARMLRLHTLSLDGQIRAALYCFHLGDRTLYYLSGFDPAPELAKFSLGTVLTARAIRHAIEEDGATEFDFLRGNEGYKYKWGARDRFNARLSLPRPGLRSRLLQVSGRAGLHLEHRFKEYMHRRHGGAGAEKPETIPQSSDSDTVN